MVKIVVTPTVKRLPVFRLSIQKAIHLSITRMQKVVAHTTFEFKRGC